MANALSSLAHISLSFIEICSLSLLKKKVLSKEGDHRFPASATRRLASWVWRFSSVVTGLEWCLHEAVRVNNKPSKIVVFISLCIMGISLLPTQKYDKKVICGKKAVRVLLQVSILRIGLLFLTHIYQIYFQMIGYNGSVYIRQCFHCFPCTSNHFVSFCLFILFFKKGPTT